MTRARLLLALAALALVVVGAPTAGAIKTEDVVLRVGSVVERHGGPFIGNTRGYETYNENVNSTDGNPYVEPAHCTGEDPTNVAATDCDTIPIRLDVDPNTLEEHTYLMSLTVNWDKIATVNSVPASGDVNVHQMNVYLWPDPLIYLDENDEETTENTGVLRPPLLVALSVVPPARLALVNPPGTTFNLVVTNRTGPDEEGYDLVARLEDLSGPLPVDFSIDTGAPVGASRAPSGASVAAPPPAPSAAQELAIAPAPALPTTPVAPSLAGVGPDSLDALGVNRNIGLDDARRLLTSTGDDLPPPGDASGLGLILSLVVAPLVLIAVLGAWLFRRRSSVFGAT